MVSSPAPEVVLIRLSMRNERLEKPKQLQLQMAQMSTDCASPSVSIRVHLWFQKHFFYLRLCVFAAGIFLLCPLFADDKKVVVLGYDALDPVLMQKWMADGRLPHFKQ